MSYVLVTDSTCDLPQNLVNDNNINVIPMEFIMDDIPYKHYLDCREMSLDTFYKNLQNGSTAKTTQINCGDFIDFFEPFLKAGKDILYICFTSKLSGTYNTCQIAVKQLKEEYPAREIVVVDSLCASIGEGLLVLHVANIVNKGATLTEAADFANDFKNKCCHWFAVDDLEQLKKGGRISAASATFAKALQIKPILSLDNEGKLVSAGKVRGIKKAYDFLVDKLIKTGEDYKNQKVFIGHTNSPEYAATLEEKVKPLVKETMICNIGPVIGSHIGSGMVAIVFIGDRNIK